MDTIPDSPGHHKKLKLTYVYYTREGIRLTC
jgi:hypothetical protein